MVTLLIQNAYVTFGDPVHHQTQGIPMGINPAVFMANYYLYYYEYQFIYRMYEILHETPAVPGGEIHATFGFEPAQAGTPAWVTSRVEDAAFDGNMVMHVLEHFRFTLRFVDDLSAACNPFIKYLLFETDSILGGLLKGIYPANGLSLEHTQADMWSFPTLDVRVITIIYEMLDEITGLMQRYVKSHTELYDKRREQCYDGITIAQYTHVSSNVGYNVSNSILMGQLHRYRELIQDRDNFVKECGLLLARMHLNGYPLPGLRRKLLHFLRSHPDMFGAVHPKSLYEDIMQKFWVLFPEEFTAGPASL